MIGTIKGFNFTKDEIAQAIKKQRTTTNQRKHFTEMQFLLFVLFDEWRYTEKK